MPQTPLRQRSAAATRDGGQTRPAGVLTLRQSLLPVAVVLTLLSQVLMISPAPPSDSQEQAPAPTAADAADAAPTPEVAVTFGESGLSWPMAAPVTSLFGPAHPLGIDLGAMEGSPVHAAAYGTVREAGYAWNYGNYVLIDHAGGYSTLYAHFEEPALVESGDTVIWGQTLGLVGSTGISTGPHLQFEVHKDDRVINPMDALPPVPLTLMLDA